jgi:hypothetical protein
MTTPRTNIEYRISNVEHPNAEHLEIGYSLLDIQHSTAVLVRRGRVYGRGMWGRLPEIKRSDLYESTRKAAEHQRWPPSHFHFSLRRANALVTKPWPQGWKSPGAAMTARLCQGPQHVSTDRAFRPLAGSGTIIGWGPAVAANHVGDVQIGTTDRAFHLSTSPLPG